MTKYRLGSVVALSDRKGEVVMRYAYEAFGQPWAGVFEPYNRYGFTGKPYDEKTGLYYYGARWYDPTVGRWLSQDPIRDGVNWYAYCNNNPVNWVDPWGLEPGEVRNGKRGEPKIIISESERIVVSLGGKIYPLSDESGNPVGVLTDVYGSERPYGKHTGLDIAAPTGTYVRAMRDATVIETGYDRIVYGKYVDYKIDTG